ncbi:MAG: VacJ family lipoprotein [Steroidobacteraceae bacterium]
MRGYTIAVLLGASLIGCAPTASAANSTTIAARSPGDPWERPNRVAYAFQGLLERHVIRPAAKLYRWLTPGPIGRGLHNVLVNLSEPAAFFNDVLQRRFKRAGIPAKRFIMNSTVGLLGLFDVAARAGVMHHNNEFGVTLGTYGVAPGPYMYVPLVGPTTVRDLLGSTVDFLTDPMHRASYDNRAKASDTRLVVSGLDTYLTTQDQLKALLSDSLDPYATLRSVYLQSKQGEIRGGNVPVDLPDFDAPIAPAADNTALEGQSSTAPVPLADHSAQQAAASEP